jgi:TolB-like protein
LSRGSGKYVIASNTAFTFKGNAIDVQQLGRELSVRYLLKGSVQRGGDRVRVNVQLIDTETRAHLWADRFDKPVTNLFEMQDEIVARLAIALNGQLIEAEARRAELSPHPDPGRSDFPGKKLAY